MVGRASARGMGGAARVGTGKQRGGEGEKAEEGDRRGLKKWGTRRGPRGAEPGGGGGAGAGAVPRRQQRQGWSKEMAAARARWGSQQVLARGRWRAARSGRRQWRPPDSGG